MKNMKIYDLHLNHLVLFLLFFALFGFHSSHAQAVSQEGQQDVTQHFIEAVQQVRTLAAQQRMEEAIALAESQRELMLAVLSLLMGEDMIRADLANAMAVAALNLGYYEESERQALSMIALPLDKNPEYKALAICQTLCGSGGYGSLVQGFVRQSGFIAAHGHARLFRTRRGGKG